jgi:integrase
VAGRSAKSITSRSRSIAALTLACGRQGHVVSLLAYTGMRFGELTGLNMEVVDLKARRSHVRRSITQVGGKLVEGNPKSAAGRRSIPNPQRLIPILIARLAGRRPGDPAQLPRWAPDSDWRTGSARSNGASP